MTKDITAPLDKLDIVVKYLEKHLASDCIIFLNGDLASGKTTLSSAIAKSKGIIDSVTSPTFSLQQVYSDKLFHYDLYRITNDEFFTLGLHEELDKRGWHLIEWADKSLKSFLVNGGYNTASITITIDRDSRNYSIEV